MEVRTIVSDCRWYTPIHRHRALFVQNMTGMLLIWLNSLRVPSFFLSSTQYDRIDAPVDTYACTRAYTH